MRCLLAQIDLLEEQQAEVEKALEELMQSIPQYITTIPGIGLATGAAILSEIGDVTRFASEDKLVAYAGIDATVHQSGQFKATEMHMSKRGSPYLRLALWQAASMAIQHNEELKAYYHKKRKEGKAHGTALGAVCRKLLIRVYVILKENRPYVVRRIGQFQPLTPNSRSYLNQFTQPDTIVPDPYNSQDWDRYSYARSNPLKYVDPDGHNPILIILALIGATIFLSQVPSDQYQPDPAEWGDLVYS